MNPYGDDILFTTEVSLVTRVIQQNLLRAVSRIAGYKHFFQTPFFSTVKPVYSGHLWFLKKVSDIGRCPLYRVLDFFEENTIIDKNITMFYVNCNSSQLYFLNNIWTILCLTLYNVSVSTFSINLFSITFIYLSP